VIGLPRRA